MTPERWQRIEPLYHAAYARPPGERATFLAAASPDDDVLRREVEALLDEPESPGGFCAGPAAAGVWAVAAVGSPADKAMIIETTAVLMGSPPSGFGAFS